MEEEELETCTREMQVHTIVCSDIWTETQPSGTRKREKVQLESKKKKVGGYFSKRRRGVDERGRCIH